MPNKIDIIGRRYGLLYVEADMPKIFKTRRRVKCVCDCGNIAIIDPRSLFVGHTRSCGCIQKATVSRICIERTTHGKSKITEYNIWSHMKSRCNNSNNAKYKDYGARGIKVCPEWEGSFETFLQDMGRRPSHCHSIDRIDVNGNYKKDNCRWALPTEQANNKRNHRVVEYEGVKIPLSLACKKTGINYRSALWRINNNKNWQLPEPPKGL